MAEVRLERFRYRRSFAWTQALHFAAAMSRSRLAAAAALLSFELDYSGRLQWLRRLLPAGEGTNVVGRLPAAGRRRRTLVLVAHHDAAQTGLIWHPRLMAAGDALAARGGRRSSLALIPELAMLAGALTRRRAPIRLLLGVAIAAVLESTRNRAVPGANDNATGVAGVLELAARLRDDRPDDVEVIVLIVGCEESGMGGMAAWLDRHGRTVDPRRTLVLGLDTVGSGEPVVLSAEGGLWPVRYREEDVRRVAARSWRIGGWTDPALARLYGLPTVSILSVRDGGFPNYHLPSDTPDGVDWACVEECVQLGESTIREW